MLAPLSLFALSCVFVSLSCAPVNAVVAGRKEYKTAQLRLRQTPVAAWHYLFFDQPVIHLDKSKVFKPANIVQKTTTGVAVGDSLQFEVGERDIPYSNRLGSVARSIEDSENELELQGVEWVATREKYVLLKNGKDCSEGEYKGGIELVIAQKQSSSSLMQHVIDAIDSKGDSNAARQEVTLWLTRIVHGCECTVKDKTTLVHCPKESARDISSQASASPLESSMFSSNLKSMPASEETTNTIPSTPLVSHQTPPPPVTTNVAVSHTLPAATTPPIAGVLPPTVGFAAAPFGHPFVPATAVAGLMPTTLRVVHVAPMQPTTVLPAIQQIHHAIDCGSVSLPSGCRCLERSQKLHVECADEPRRSRSPAFGGSSTKRRSSPSSSSSNIASSSASYPYGASSLSQSSSSKRRQRSRSLNSRSGSRASYLSSSREPQKQTTKDAVEVNWTAEETGKESMASLSDIDPTSGMRSSVSAISPSSERRSSVPFAPIVERGREEDTGLFASRTTATTPTKSAPAPQNADVTSGRRDSVDFVIHETLNKNSPREPARIVRWRDVELYNPSDEATGSSNSFRTVSA